MSTVLEYLIVSWSVPDLILTADRLIEAELDIDANFPNKKYMLSCFTLYHDPENPPDYQLIHKKLSRNASMHSHQLNLISR